MNPKKIDYLFNEAAKELGIAESDLNDIVSFYWLQVRKKLESLEEPNILVEGLGTFYTKPKALKSEMLKYEAFIKSINSKEFTRYPYYKIARSKLDKLQVLSNKIFEETLRQKAKINQRYGDSTGDMEKEK